jgi:quinol-cytochrome oxidoreductase complex cytochrome b subunit
LLEKIKNYIFNSQIWKSVFRHGTPDTERNQSLVIFSNVMLHLHPVKVKKHGLKMNYTWCLGGLAFFLFIILTVTGIMLMFYYVPDAHRAYSDMKDMAYVITYGTLMRNVHRWAAHSMVIVVMFHMARVFYTGSYKAPREFNWVVGVLLLVLTLLLSFTGYLLPWDQLAIWAITVGSNMARATPFLGYEGPGAAVLGMRIDNDARFMLLGGTTVGQATLLRFYVLHCIFIPFFAALLMAVHFWRIRKDGGISGPL